VGSPRHEPRLRVCLLEAPLEKRRPASLRKPVRRRGSRYNSGDNDLSLKTKTFTEGEFEVIGADLSPTGALVAVLEGRNEHGLHYGGDAFITLKAADRKDFRAYAEAHTVDTPVLPLKRRGTWLKPGLVAKVKHLRGDGMLRHASLKSLRHAR
jgi:bifunctional non-homologous end joining protein LigD